MLKQQRVSSWFGIEFARLYIFTLICILIVGLALLLRDSGLREKAPGRLQTVSNVVLPPAIATPPLFELPVSPKPASRLVPPPPPYVGMYPQN